MSKPEEEILFGQIEAVIDRMRGKTPPDEMKRIVRSRYEHPQFFIESNRYFLQQLGFSRIDAYYFTLIPLLSRFIERERFGDKPRLNRLSLMVDYLKALYIGMHVECFYLILLDRNGRLMDAVLISKGTVDTALFDLEEMLSTVIQREARAVVICHNHPHGTMKPSREDIACTYAALNATLAIEVPLVDHIIVGQGRAMSIRDSGMIPSQLWDMQSEKSKWMREWVDVDLLDDSLPQAATES